MSFLKKYTENGKIKFTSKIYPNILFHKNICILIFTSILWVDVPLFKESLLEADWILG